jgi:hypothetical protein
VSFESAYIVSGFASLVSEHTGAGLLPYTVELDREHDTHTGQRFGDINQAQQPDEVRVNISLWLFQAIVAADERREMVMRVTPASASACAAMLSSESSMMRTRSPRCAMFSACARRKIVKYDNFDSFTDKAVAQVRPNEARAACNQNFQSFPPAI